ncbi:tetratricopeptide (TPR) repeat protein, partial [Methanococcus voltae]|uniref:tetratricopeptide repeat protein n=1 Tax=Methanococcus voltae TaxID=2188 RepID=UPI001AE4E6E4
EVVNEEVVNEEVVNEEVVNEEVVNEEVVNEEVVNEEETPEYWFNLANMAKDNNKKIEYYNKALDINPNYENAINGKEAVLKSIKELERLEEIRKNKETAKKFCKMAYGEKDKATQLKYYEKALKLDSDNIKILLNCAVAHHNLKEYNEALNYYDKALDINPGYESAVNGKKIVSKLLKQIEDAKKLCKMAYGEKDKATQLKYYEKALKLDSDNIKILLNCAVSHYNLKNYKICNEYALKILKIDKNNSKAKELIELCNNKK